MEKNLSQTITRWVIVLGLVITALVIGFSLGNRSQVSQQPGTPTQTEITTPTIVNTPVPEEGGAPETQLVNTATPAPTSTPGVITNFVGQISSEIGADEVTFAGLTGEDWINLLVSILVTLVSILLISRIVYFLLKIVVQRTSTRYDELLLKKVRPQITWLIGLLALQISTLRLAFLEPIFKQWLYQISSSLYVIVIAIFLWKSLDVVFDWYRNEVETQHGEHRQDTILMLLHRIGKFFLITISVIMVLSINNVNVSVLIASLGVLGLAVSLAAQDSLANLISGVLIALDQPFRVGDRIEIQGLGTWGDVVDIGLRSTRIRTRDNILVIVPNSKIGGDQVINYTYPDPQFRIQMNINIPYGESVERVRELIVNTVRDVEGVLPDKPVEALYDEMGGTGMVFRIRWWIESYIDMRRMFDRVNTSLQQAFDEAGLGIPNPAYDIHLINPKKPMKKQNDTQEKSGLN